VAAAGRSSEVSGSAPSLLDHYVSAALVSEVYRVGSAQPGERCNALIAAAIALGQLVSVPGFWATTRPLQGWAV
jgi:hypothetical protein